MKIRQLSLAAVTVCVLTGATVVIAQSLPSDLDAKSRARLPYVQRKDTDESSKRLIDIFVRGATSPTDELGGPLAFAAYNVPVANALLDLHDGAVGKGTLNDHVRELAILVACRETNYDFEWNAHEAAAVRAGVSNQVIDAVRTHGALAGLPEADVAVVRFGHELLHDREMSSATFAKAKELFGAKGAMDLVAVMSTYAVSGFYAIAVDERVAAGAPTLPPPAR